MKSLRRNVTVCCFLSAFIMFCIKSLKQAQEIIKVEIIFGVFSFKASEQLNCQAVFTKHINLHLSNIRTVFNKHVFVSLIRHIKVFLFLRPQSKIYRPPNLHLALFYLTVLWDKNDAVRRKRLRPQSRSIRRGVLTAPALVTKPVYKTLKSCTLSTSEKSTKLLMQNVFWSKDIKVLFSSFQILFCKETALWSSFVMKHGGGSIILCDNFSILCHQR